MQELKQRFLDLFFDHSEKKKRTII